MAERGEARIAGEQVPRQAHHRPDRHQRQHKLVVAVGDEQRDAEIAGREDHQGDPVATQPWCGTRPHARSAERPNRPCGRSMMISRNTTKIAAFCNCGGRIREEHCWTKPTVRPPQKAPRMLPMPPNTTPEYIMMT